MEALLGAKTIKIFTLNHRFRKNMPVLYHFS
jgi:hypothetical protein